MAEKDKPIGLMIALGKKKEGPSEELEPEAEADEGGAFEAAAAEVYAAAKADDAEGFTQALRLAIQSLI